MSNDQAIVISQALVHGKWLECVYQGHQAVTAGGGSGVSSLVNYYSSNVNSKFEPNQAVFYDESSFYKPGYV